MKFAIGIDLGGTRIKGIAADADGNTLHQLYMPTNDNDEAVWKEAVADTVHELQQKINNTDGVVGISAPGFRKRNGLIRLPCVEPVASFRGRNPVSPWAYHAG